MRRGRTSRLLGVRVRRSRFPLLRVLGPLLLLSFVQVLSEPVGTLELEIPSLCLYELNSIFIKKGLTLLESRTAFELLDELIQQKVIQVTHVNPQLLNKAYEIAQIDTQGQGHISVYDATFHALALLNNTTLLTADIKHHRKTKDHVGKITLLDEIQV